MKNATNAFDTENIKYLEGLIGKDKVQVFLRLSENSDEVISEEERKACETIKNCLTVMQEWGENRWWTSDEKRIIAYYQMMDLRLLVPVDKFHEALEDLLGRPVWTHELGFNWDGVKAEVERAFNGIQDTKEEREKTINKSFEQLANSDMEVIGIVI